MSELIISIGHRKRPPKVVSGSWYIIYSMVLPASIKNGVVDKEKFKFIFEEKDFQKKKDNYFKRYYSKQEISKSNKMLKRFEQE
eukprot:gene11561-4809_t